MTVIEYLSRVHLHLRETARVQIECLEALSGVDGFGVVLKLIMNTQDAANLVVSAQSQCELNQQIPEELIRA